MKTKLKRSGAVVETDDICFVYVRFEGFMDGCGMENHLAFLVMGIGGSLIEERYGNPDPSDPVDGEHACMCDFGQLKHGCCDKFVECRRLLVDPLKISTVFIKTNTVGTGLFGMMSTEVYYLSGVCGGLPFNKYYADNYDFCRQDLDKIKEGMSK